MTKKTKPEKKTYAVRLTMFGATNKRIEKFVDHIFDGKWGPRIGVASIVPVPDDQIDNAAERVLDRLDNLEHPLAHKHLAYSHGYRQGIRTARLMLVEELARHHGE